MPCRFHPFILTKLASACMSLCLAVSVLVTPMRSTASGNDFDTVIDAAAGQTVYFNAWGGDDKINAYICLLYTSPSPRDATLSRMPSSA